MKLTLPLSRNYSFFQTSFFIIALGTRCTQLAIAWWVLSATGSPALFAKFIAYASLAEVIAQPVLGSLGDQFNRPSLVIVANLLSVWSVVMLLIVCRLGAFHGYLLAALMVLLSIASGIRKPLESSMLPMLVDKHKLADAFRIKAMMHSIAILVGPGLAGVLVTYWGIKVAFMVDVIAIVAACGMMMQLNTSPPATRSKQTWIQYRRDWAAKTKAGMRALIQVKAEFYLALLAMMINFALYPFFLILVPVLVKEYLHFPAWFIGVMDISFGIGILVASAFVVQRVNQWCHRHQAIFIGFILLAMALLATATVHFAWFLPIFMVLGGIGLMLVNINTSIVRSLATPEHYRNRMQAGVIFISTLANPIGSYASSFALQSMGIIATILILGIIVLIASWFILFTPQIRTVMKQPTDKLENVYPVLYPQAFTDSSQE